MRFRLLCGATVAVAALGVAASGLVGSTAIASAASGYTCAGGSIPSGSYASITVTGFCDVEQDALINVTGNITVAPGAIFDAESAPSTITVGKNVTAGSGSFLGLGCQWKTANAPWPCTTEASGFSVITVHGNVTATGATIVLLNGITVDKNVTLTGGGGAGGPYGYWQEANDTIGGNLTISDVTPDWLGVEFSTVAGNMNLSNITAASGGVSVVVNTVGRNLNCSGLGTSVSGGYIPGQQNIVGHNTNGQCVGLIGG